jgi:hypothetical protein
MGERWLLFVSCDTEIGALDTGTTLRLSDGISAGMAMDGLHFG